VAVFFKAFSDKQRKKKRGLNPAGASCHSQAGQGQGDRSTKKSRRPHFFKVWLTRLGMSRRKKELHMPCQNLSQQRFLFS